MLDKMMRFFAFVGGCRCLLYPFVYQANREWIHESYLGFYEED